MRRFTTASAVLTAVAVPLLGVVVAPSPTLAADTSAVPGTAFSKLHAVSASSPTDAWAVGFRALPGEHNIGLTRHWDGAHWTTVPSVHPGEYSFVWGVADLSPTDAWAVGETLGGATELPFAEHWDGTAWQQVPLRDGPGLGKLLAVTAIGPDDVWMVGTDYPSPFQTAKMFIMHWNGSTIHRVRPGRLLHNRSSELRSISAAASNDVWAVGGHGSHGQTDLPLLEHYDGTRWSAVPGDPDVATSSGLGGVAAIPGGDAWAVGWQAADGDPGSSAFAEHWDGTQWTESPVRTRGFSTFLNSVSMVASDDVWAVGNWQRSEQDRRSRPLVEHWDGQTWSIVRAPSGGPGMSSEIESVSMVSDTAGIAVGERTDGAHTTLYNTHWNGEVWSRP